MAIKLNKDMRQKIVHNLVKKSFKNDFDGMSKEFSAFTNSVYEDIYSKKIREQMESLPKGWLPTAKAFKVQFGGDITWLNFDGSNIIPMLSYSVRHQWQGINFDKDKTGIARLIFAKHNNNGVLKIFEHNDKFTKKFEDLKGRFGQLAIHINEAYNKVKATIDSYHSVEKLTTDWPECLPYVDKVTPVSLPATNFAELNTLLRLP